MPLIQPPNEYEEPEEPTSSLADALRKKPTSWYTWFFNVPNWKCVECGTVMMGRVKYCVYCKQRLHKDTLRPPDFDEGLPYEGESN